MSPIYIHWGSESITSVCLLFCEWIQVQLRPQSLPPCFNLPRVPWNPTDLSWRLPRCPKASCELFISCSHHLVFAILPTPYVVCVLFLCVCNVSYDPSHPHSYFLEDRHQTIFIFGEQKKCLAPEHDRRLIHSWYVNLQSDMRERCFYHTSGSEITAVHV